MTALCIEQFQKHQTNYSGSYLCGSPIIKFDTVARCFKRINEKVVLKRNDARIRPQDAIIFKFNMGTAINEGMYAHQNATEVPKIYSTLGTGSLDFWLGEANLSDYGKILDDYDVTEVEEIHMQCASKYGW